jgi:nucleoid-associated protein YgaU
MSPSAFNLNGFRAEGSLGSGGELAQHATPAPMIEHQLNSPADIGKAHQFFQPGAQAAQVGNAAIGQAQIGNAALGQAQIGNAAISQAAVGNAAIGNAALAQPLVPGGDAGSFAAKAMQLAQQQISPLIQLIMRMPGHIGLINNFFECIAGFFTHHAQLIGGLDPTLLASAHGDLGAQFMHAAPLGEHMPLDLHLLPHGAPFLQNFNLQNFSLHDGALSNISLGGSEHGFNLSYINDHLLPNHDLNVSGTLDGVKPQYEGLSFNDPHGEIISGPSMSHASPAHHLADDKSLLLEKGFSAGHSNPALAANPSAATSSISTAGSSQINLASAQVPTASNLPTSLNVGSSAFAAPPTSAASATVGNVGTADGASLSSMSAPSGIDNSSFGPSGAVSDKLGGQQLLAMNKPDVDISAHPGSEYGANFIKSQSAGGGATEGLHAKELSLDSFKPGHKVADSGATHHAETNHGNALEKLHKQSHEVAAKHTTLAHQAHKAVTAAKPSASTAGSKNLSVTSEPKIASAEGADAAPEQPAGAEGADGAAGTDTTAGVDYKIQAGDNLWNIAKDKLGDATKWGDIFKLNSDTIGANPSMIHPGVTLHMPGQSLAHHATEASKYVVKSGDNLWNISKNNLGDATKWGEVYKLNHEIIGANPGLIKPGTELTMPGSPDASGQLADASGVPGAPGADAGSTAAAAAPAPEQVASSVPTQSMPVESTAPSQFGHPEGMSAEAPVHAQPIAGTHLPNQSLDPSMPPSGAATAAEPPAAAVGPGAAGAATLPVTNTAQFGVPNGGASNPENASVVSSSVGNDLASFLSRKK